MAININIANKHLYLISAIFVFLVGVGLVISGAGAGASPNPGHDLDTIQGFKSGEADLGASLTALDTRIVTCRWVDMTKTSDKPGGGSCAATNNAAYITASTANIVGVTGYCKYTTNHAYGKIVYGNLMSRATDSNYDSDRVVVCYTNAYSPTIALSSGSCGITVDGIAQYMVCN